MKVRFRIRYKGEIICETPKDDFEIIQHSDCYEISDEWSTEIELSTLVNDINGVELFVGDKVKYDGRYCGDYWLEAGEGIIDYDDGEFIICYLDAPQLDSASVYNYNIRKVEE